MRGRVDGEHGVNTLGHVAVGVQARRPKLVLWGPDLSRVYVRASFWCCGEEVPPEIAVRDTFSHDYIDD